MKVKDKKPISKIFLRGFIILLCLWVLLAVIDFIRFAKTEDYIQPIITVSQVSCKCGESKVEYGLGYSFSYEHYDSSNFDWSKFDSKSFCFFDLELFTQE